MPFKCTDVNDKQTDREMDTDKHTDG